MGTDYRFLVRPIETTHFELSRSEFFHFRKCRNKDEVVLALNQLVTPTEGQYTSTSDRPLLLAVTLFSTQWIDHVTSRHVEDVEEGLEKQRLSFVTTKQQNVLRVHSHLATTPPHPTRIPRSNDTGTFSQNANPLPKHPK